MNPWDEWEDYQAGLYDPEWHDVQVVDSYDLLRDVDRFESTATEMLRAWPVAAIQNLVYLWSGRLAWVGHASCLYSHGAPRAATCAAWGLLTNAEQTAANRTARTVIGQWEVDRHAETLFTM